MVHDPEQLAARYVDLWNEADAADRRAAIAALWQPDAVHYVAAREARGHKALELRVKGSHDKNVGEGGCGFRPSGIARALRDVVTFEWEMVRVQTNEVAARGLEFLVMGSDGLIASDYQFIVA